MYKLVCADFAVGAPYDGEDSRGSVSIFLGSREGVVKKPSQVILTVRCQVSDVRCQVTGDR